MTSRCCLGNASPCNTVCDKRRKTVVSVSVCAYVYKIQGALIRSWNGKAQCSNGATQSHGITGTSKASSVTAAEPDMCTCPSDRQREAGLC